MYTITRAITASLQLLSPLLLLLLLLRLLLLPTTPAAAAAAAAAATSSRLPPTSTQLLASAAAPTCYQVQPEIGETVRVLHEVVSIWEMPDSYHSP